MSSLIKIEIAVDEKLLQQLQRDRNRIQILAMRADADADEERAQIEASNSDILLDLLSDYIDHVDLPEDRYDEDDDGQEDDE